jgi:glycosyltransferase 2 family protein
LIFFHYQPDCTMMSPAAKRWLMSGIKFGIIALLIWGGWGIFRTAYETIQREKVDYESWHWGLIALAMVVYLFGQVPAALYWYVTLRDQHQQPPFWVALRAHLIGHLGKYVPGKALVVIIRAALVRGPHVQTGPTVAAIFYETFVGMAAGSLLALIVLWPLADWTLLKFSWQFFKFDTLEKLPAGADPRLTILALGLLCATGLPSIPAVFRLLIQKLKAVKSAATRSAELEANPTTHAPRPFHMPWSHLVGGLLGHSFGWILQGASLWATIRGLGYDLDLWSNLPLLSACAALAIVAGFVSLIPGGALVRELIFMLILGPLVGHNAVLQVIVPCFLRIEWLIAELIMAGILYVIPVKSHPHLHPAAPSNAAGP